MYAATPPFDLSALTLLTGLATLALGIYVLASERGSRVSLAGALFAAAVSVWMLSYSRLYQATSAVEALRWVQLGYLGVPFIPAAVYHFSVLLLQIEERRARSVRLGWLLAALFSLSAFTTEALIAGLYRYPWGYYADYGWLGLPFLAYFSWYMGWSVRVLWAEHRAAEPGVHKLRARAFTLSFAGALVGSVDFLPKYGIPIYPFGFVGIGFCVAACVYIIRRYRLVDITPSFAAGEIITTMSDVLIVCDARGRIRVTNGAATGILGYSEPELLGMSAASLAPPQAEARQRWLAVMERPGARDEEVELWTREREPVALSASTTELRDRYGTVVGTVVIARDIRARKRTEAELRDREERYRSLFEQNPDAVYSIDLEGRFVSVNRACSLLTGYATEQLVGMSYQTLLVPEDVERTNEHFRRVAAGEHQNYDIAICAADRRRIDLNVTGVPIVVDGKLVGMYGIAKDITERKRAQQELAERTDQLERSNRELEQFAYVASHDLQEPLRKIQAFGDRLKTRHAAGLGDTGRDYLERMQGAAGRMQTLIQDLLAFSRVATKPQPFQCVDLALVAREVVSDLEARIQQTGGRVELRDLPKVVADPLQMRQLLQNLIGNALKFHRPGVPPVVEVYAAPDWTGTASLASLTVRDNGIGFEERYLDRIFAPFQRLHGRTEYEGTGMGLAICRKIAERHGGTLTAQSIVGEGSAFVVALPVHHAEPALA